MSSLLDIVSTGLVPRTIGMQEFAESSDYCNRALYPRQVVLLKLVFLEEMNGYEEDILDEWIAGGRNGGVLLSPDIRERRDFLRDEGYKHFREVQLVGGRRSSKGFMTGLGLAKIMFDTLQLGDPREYYSIESPQIMFSCIAASESQAKEYQYGDFVTTIEGCKAFQPYLMKSLETEFNVATASDLRKISANKARGGAIQRSVASLVGTALASNAGTLRGSSTMAACIDEMAHMLPGESKAAADKVYEAIKPSMDQFDKDGLLFMNSSPYSKVGMFYDLYAEGLRRFDPLAPIEFDRAIVVHDESGFAIAGDADDDEEGNGDPRFMMFQFPSWALFERYRKYKSKYKQRLRGREWDKAITVSPDWDPNEVDEEGDFIHSDKDKQGIMAAKREEARNPEVYRVERRGQFAEVTDAFLSPFMVDRMYRGVPAGIQIQVDGSKVPRYEPIWTNMGGSAPLREGVVHRYKFHCDPSSNTAGFGFAIAHIEFFPNLVSEEHEEHVVFDMIKRWDPKKMGGVIRWNPILDEISMYATIFNPYEITFDQHQSAEPIQDLSERLRQRNMTTSVHMVNATNELNWKRWEVFKTALYQGRVHAPDDEAAYNLPTCKDELKFLQEIKTGGRFPRVEKQDMGPVQMKDQADCAAECVYSLIGNMILTHMRDRLASSITPGAEGGFAIGYGGPRGPIGGAGPPGLSGFYSTAQEKIVERGMDRSSMTRSALGMRGKMRGARNRGRW